MIHQMNCGLVSARQAGALAAAGEYIICIDGDDWVDPGYFAAVDRIIFQFQPDMVVLGCFSEEIHHNGYKKHRGLSGPCGQRSLCGMDKLSLLLTQELIVSLCCKVCRRDVYVPAQMKVDREITLSEDYLCTLACLLDTESIYLSEDAYYRYRNNSASMTHTFSLDQVYNLERSVAFIEKMVVCANPEITEGIDRFILNYFHSILIRGYRYANYRTVKKIVEDEPAKRLLPRIRRLSFRPMNFKAAVKFVLIKNEWWMAHFIISNIYWLLKAVRDCFYLRFEYIRNRIGT